MFERVFQAQIAFFADQFQKRLKALKQPDLRGWLRAADAGLTAAACSGTAPAQPVKPNPLKKTKPRAQALVLKVVKMRALAMQRPGVSARALRFHIGAQFIRRRRVGHMRQTDQNHFRRSAGIESGLRFPWPFNKTCHARDSTRVDSISAAERPRARSLAKSSHLHQPGNIFQPRDPMRQLGKIGNDDGRVRASSYCA